MFEKKCRLFYVRTYNFTSDKTGEVIKGANCGYTWLDPIEKEQEKDSLSGSGSGNAAELRRLRKQDRTNYAKLCLSAVYRLLTSIMTQAEPACASAKT